MLTPPSFLGTTIRRMPDGRDLSYAPPEGECLRRLVRTRSHCARRPGSTSLACRAVYPAPWVSGGRLGPRARSERNGQRGFAISSRREPWRARVRRSYGVEQNGVNVQNKVSRTIERQCKRDRAPRINSEWRMITRYMKRLCEGGRMRACAGDVIAPIALPRSCDSRAATSRTSGPNLRSAR